MRSRWPHDHIAPVCSNVIGTPVDKRTHTALSNRQKRTVWLKSRAGHEGAGLLPDRQDVSLHNIPGYLLHAVLCKEGSFTCAVVSVSITLTGKTSHAAEPQKGISPIPAMLTIVDELSRWNNTDMQSDDYFLSTIVEIHVGEEAYGVSAGNGVIRPRFEPRQTNCYTNTPSN